MRGFVRDLVSVPGSMGKSRGGKGKGRQFSAPEQLEQEESEEEEEVAGSRSLGGQSANAGMMPPSDSDESEDEMPRGQNANAGMMPPSDSDSDDGDAPPPKGKVGSRVPSFAHTVTHRHTHTA